MNRGLLKSILYYVIGFLLTWISYLIFGHTYIHAPAAYHLILLLTFLGGFLWLAGAMIQYFFGVRSQNLKWIIVVNLSMCLSFVLLLTWLFNYPSNNKAELPRDQIIIEEAGDTTTIYNQGNIVYYKVKDSVLLNFIDSSKVDWSKTELRKK